MKYKLFYVILSVVVLIICIIGGFYLFLWRYSEYKRCLHYGTASEPLDYEKVKTDSKKENLRILKEYSEQIEKDCNERYPVGSRVEFKT